MSLWFRFYSGVVDDPKAQMLAPDIFKHWVNVLCIAAQHDGELPPIAVTAFSLRMTEPKAAGILAKLHALDLLDKTEKSFKPHNWDGRQFKSDLTDNTNAIRQKNHRARKRDELRELKALRDASHNALRNGGVSNGVSHVTAKRPDTDTERITTTASVERGLGDGKLTLSAAALAGIGGRKQ